MLSKHVLLYDLERTNQFIFMMSAGVPLYMKFSQNYLIANVHVYDPIIQVNILLRIFFKC